MKVYILNILIPFMFVGCGSYNDNTSQKPTFSGAIVDSTSWYQDESRTVRDANITFLTPNASLCAPYTNPSAALRSCTFTDVLNDSSPYDAYKPSLSVAFTTATFSLSNEVSNALLFQKGKSTRRANQKSWKIKLDSNTSLYESQRRLQYNKQFYDMTRLRNKLSFDLFQGIPNFASLKTEFVHLGIDKVDKGLFTKVESYDKEYLLNRGWSKDENLYKAQNFVFFLKPELALTDKGVPVDLVAFSTIIEPQRGKKQTKLIEMIKAVNNNSISIDTVIAKYFNRENYLTWLAINILTGNVDTISQNFFLLNPVNSDTFYFLPWDYDDGWGWYKQQNNITTNFYARWHKSIARWWDSPLHSKFFRVKKNRDDLDLKIAFLRANYFTDAQIQAKVDSYKAVAGPFILKAPDLDNIIYLDSDSNITRQNWGAECDILKTRLQENIDEYNSQKGSPMPFWQVATYSGGTLTLLWDASVDFENDKIVYDILVGSDPDFNVTDVNLSNQVAGTDLGLTSFAEVSYVSPVVLASGKHYVKIRAKEALNPNHYRFAFDSFSDGNKIYNGVLEFVVP